MKKVMRIICVAASLIITMITVASCLALSDNHDIPFTSIAEGYFLRDENDHTSSAVICDETGLNQFLNKYPIVLNIKSGFFKKNLLIVGFSDTMWGVRCDSLKFILNHKSGGLYLDLHDKGIMFKAAPVPKGKKHTAWCAISVINNLSVSNVQIREGIPGLCQQFGTKTVEQ